jgi:hypothetical protein
MMRALEEDVFGVADGERRTVGAMGICPLLVTVKNEKRQGHTKPDAGANAHRGPGVNGEIGGEVERGLKSLGSVRKLWRGMKMRFRSSLRDGGDDFGWDGEVGQLVPLLEDQYTIR